MSVQVRPAPAPVHEFVVKQFTGSRTRYAGCTGCAWVGPFLYDNTREEHEQLARAFEAKHRAPAPPGR